jgi:hypothetical protein
MKVGSCLFALLACGAMSTDVAAADKPKTAVTAGIGLKQDSNSQAAIAASNTKAAKATAAITNPSPAAAQAADKAANSAALAVVAKNPPSISGTGLVRPGTGTGSVGGSAKIAGGSIGGNGVQVKHP